MAEIARVTISGSDYGQLTQNVLHFEWLGVSWDPTAIAAEIVAGWMPNILWFSKSNFRYNSILVQHATQPTLQTVNLPIVVDGNVVNDPRMPPFVACVLKISTLQGGRTGRGRIFLAGVGADSLTSGVFTASFISTRQPKIDALKARYGLSGSSQLRLGLFNRTTNAFNGMSNLVLRPTPGVQRRRNIGIGV
jgi:hypothetical protein